MKTLLYFAFFCNFDLRLRYSVSIILQNKNLFLFCLHYSRLNRTFAREKYNS